jgi:hypothetical protein
MKPKISILDEAFVYRPSYATAITETWRRFGWRPSRRGELKSHQQPDALDEVPRIWKSEKATKTSALR